MKRWAEAFVEGDIEIENLRIGDTYRLTPHNNRYNSGVSFTFRDSTLAGIPSLVAEAGIRMRGSHLLDHYSGAIEIGENEWRDSLRLSYHKKKYGADLNTTFQQYGNYLTDKRKDHEVNWRPPSTIGSVQFFWKPTPAHNITAGASRSITHPSYQQICWYDRQGAIEGQLFRGDPTLSSDGTTRLMATASASRRESHGTAKKSPAPLKRTISRSAVTSTGAET